MLDRPTPDDPRNTVAKRCCRCNAFLNRDSILRGYETCWGCSRKHDGYYAFDEHRLGGCEYHGFSNWKYRRETGRSGWCLTCQKQERYGAR